MSESDLQPLLPAEISPPPKKIKAGFLHTILYGEQRLRCILLFTFLLKGFVDGSGLLYLQQVSLCRETLGVGAKKCQVMYIIALVPKSLRGVLALILADCPHRLGFWVMMASTLCSAACLCVVGIALIIGGSSISHIFVGVMIGVVNLGLCIMDIVIQASFAQLHMNASVSNAAKSQNGVKSMQEPEDTISQGALVFYTSQAWQTGNILAAVFAGIIIEVQSPIPIFFLAMLPFLFMAWQLYSGQMDLCLQDFFSYETKTTLSESGTQSSTSFFSKLAILISVFSLFNSMMCIFSDSELAIAVPAILFFAVLMALNTHLSQQSGRHANEEEELSFTDYPLYSIVILSTVVLYVNISSAESFFVTANLPDCNKNAPKLSYLEFNTIGAIITAISGWAGMRYEQSNIDLAPNEVFYDRFVRIQLMGLFAGAIDIFLPLGVFNSGRSMNRWFYFLVYCVLGPFVSQVYWLGNVSSIWPKIMPRNNLRIAVPCFMSMVSYGSVVSSQIGLILMQFFNLQACFDCNFSGLSWLMFVSHIVFPALTLWFFFEFSWNPPFLIRRQRGLDDKILGCIPYPFDTSNLLKKVN